MPFHPFFPIYHFITNFPLFSPLFSTTFPPFPNNPKAKYKIIDLFAGIEETRLGFHLTGQCQTVFSSEIDKFAK
ncbi:cytosine-specific methyltransferase [Mycoplasma wenyonii str. Massachusetts]|uniref:Cytosine-specific methyltransferase n=1 Tax=Mycoplasma wenyonii (strain Massachusetts) TaxID=1197325 RepID=I6YLC3_MYCWM|nr:cytosine-specific methyltransferase [Mycoplasma wenyonii str. Massachusetts]